LTARHDASSALRQSAPQASWIKKTDWLSLQADTAASLGKVLRLDGRESDAAAVFQESLELYERKGNRTYARKIRELLEQPRN
jgi:hypothetical protein